MLTTGEDSRCTGRAAPNVDTRNGCGIILSDLAPITLGDGNEVMAIAFVANTKSQQYASADQLGSPAILC